MKLIDEDMTQSMKKKNDKNERKKRIWFENDGFDNRGIHD